MTQNLLIFLEFLHILCYLKFSLSSNRFSHPQSLSYPPQPLLLFFYMQFIFKITLIYVGTITRSFFEADENWVIVSRDGQSGIRFGSGSFGYRLLDLYRYRNSFSLVSIGYMSIRLWSVRIGNYPKLFCS